MRRFCWWLSLACLLFGLCGSGVVHGAAPRPLPLPSCAISWSARPLSPAQCGFLAHLSAAAAETGVPLAALVAVWQRECSLDPVCPRSVDPYSFGPMQITQAAAERHGCPAKWRTLPAATAQCAAQILSHWYWWTDRRWTLAFTGYHRPQDLVDFGWRPSGYGIEVYHLMLRRQVDAKRIIQVAMVEK